ncbi:hypothetical protein J2752_001293 [Halarchaeum rubridurum]|uniref:DUF4330 family protein n=1 Tax=Halarchaeum rubridurum TaxID=489911 RepID=A0A830FYG4_9EURY|nr:DUF4330 domain-containing protein [Halarchaeum rubridurum]MBP1954381.1 hypothetical protein [Halarchaeum rubridurum]GGM60506.1 hypothetical protein GCM10009017_08380 [Halarchaeum rubridurum]
MRLVDEDGRLFGRVNVVDAAVVLVVLAAVVAGAVAVVPLGGGGEPATRYATVDLGTQSPATAERIDAGDRSADERVVVTDTYVGPAGDGANASVVVRVRVNGTLRDGGDERVFERDGEPLRRGDGFAFETSSYAVAGDVLRVEEAGTTLPVGSLPVLLEATLSPATADAVAVGDAFRLDDRRIARVTGVTTAPVENGTARRALLGVRLHTLNRSGSTYFGATPVRLGGLLRFDTDQYALRGTVTRWGNASPPGSPTTTTAVVSLADVDPAVADGLRAGLTERRDGRTTARITAVRTENATVVLTSDDGHIYEREHPENVDVHLTVDLRTRATADGLRFHTRALREGTRVTFDFRTVTVDGTVTRIRG